MRILNIKIEVSNSFMGSRLRWRTNWCLCGTRSCWGKDTSSSALTNYSRTKPTLFTQDTARYTTLSWTCVLPLQHTASLRTSQRHCQCMWKNQGSWNFFHAKLIPNSSSAIEVIHKEVDLRFLQLYLNEYCWKFNRRFFRDSKLAKYDLFYKLIRTAANYTSDIKWRNYNTGY